MTRWSRHSIALLAILGASAVLLAADPAPRPKDSAPKFQVLPDLSEFRTVDNAVTTRIIRRVNQTSSQPGYLGIHLNGENKGKLVIANVEADSPAARGGLQPGDVLHKLDGQATRDAGVVREVLQLRSPGDTLKVTVLRKDKPVEVTVRLAATSRPLTGSGPRALQGLLTSEREDGLRVDRLLSSSPVAGSGLKAGDVIVKVDNAPIGAGMRLGDMLGEKKNGDTVNLAIKRDGKDLDIKLKLPAEDNDASRYAWDNRTMTRWKLDVYRLAVVLIEYPDAEHNAKITAREWEKALFSRNVYTDKSSTGQKVYGSMNDYYHEISCGTFRVDGKVFEHIKVNRKRTEYGNDTNKTALLTEALDKILARDGKDALKDFDGMCFIYAGERVRTNRGNLYWPHRATITHHGKRSPYFICAEGGAQMGNISVYCHEFGHMLGLPDLYARPENPGSEGVGVWCAMSNQLPNGRPQHFSAWSKEELGWLKPAVIDPTVKQKLILAPVENSPKECFKVLVRPDGSEYLLLENRSRRGWDHDLPGEGLIIWRIVDGKPFLEESHGITGPNGPRSYTGSIPYPSKSNNAFTPYTTPSSRSQKGGGLPVHITNIQRLPDGRITFFVGYEYL